VEEDFPEEEPELELEELNPGEGDRSGVFGRAFVPPDFFPPELRSTRVLSHSEQILFHAI